MGKPKRKTARWAQTSAEYKDMQFLFTWQRLAARGQCDGAGGMQYRFVSKAWRRARRPKGIGVFILSRTGTGPVPDPN